MQNIYLVRTAAAATLAALFLAAGWVEMQDDGVQVAPHAVAVSGEPLEALQGYFPAGFALQPNAAEPEFFEYY